MTLSNHNHSFDAIVNKGRYMENHHASTFKDFNLRNVDDLPLFIENYGHYFNNDRLSYKLNYKTPAQFRTEQGLG